MSAQANSDVLHLFKDEIKEECTKALKWAEIYLTPAGAEKTKFTSHLVAALVYIYEVSNNYPIDIGNLLCRAAGQFKIIEARRLNNSYRFTGSTLYQMLKSWALAKYYPPLFSVSLICAQYELLHHAAYREDLPLFKWLLDNGVNVEMKDRCGRTALHLVAMHSLYKIADELVDRKASFITKDAEGKTPFEIALSRERFQIADFLKPTFFCNKILADGETLFFRAIRKDKEKECRYLAKYAEYSLLNSARQSVFHAAVWTGNVEILTLLLHYHRDVRLLNLIDDFGWSPLHTAVIRNQIPLIEVLLLAGAEITPHIVNEAKESGSDEIIDLINRYHS